LDQETVDGQPHSIDPTSPVQAPTAPLPLRSRGPVLTFDYTGLSPDLADAARATAERIRFRLRDNIIGTGRDLLAIKTRMQHGAFGAWIKAELNITDRSAERYMGAARLADKSDTVSVLPVASVYLLAAPSAPAGIVAEVLDAAAAGNVLPLPALKAKIAAAIEAERSAAEAQRMSAIEAAKSPEQIKRERKARESKATRQARKAAREQAEREKQEREEQDRAARLCPLAERIAAAIGPGDLTVLVRALGDWHERATLRHLLREAACEATP
jgi:hypothetical protein